MIPESVQRTGKLTDLGPLRPPAPNAPGWPVWKTPAAVERGKPEQAYTEGAAVRAVIEALGAALWAGTEGGGR